MLQSPPGHDAKLEQVMGLQFRSSAVWEKLEYPLAIIIDSYCVIPRNIPFVIQRDVLVCEQSNS